MKDERLKCLVQRLNQGFAEDLWGIILFGSRARGEAEMFL